MDRSSEACDQWLAKWIWKERWIKTSKGQKKTQKTTTTNTIPKSILKNRGIKYDAREGVQYVRKKTFQMTKYKKWLNDEDDD